VTEGKAADAQAFLVLSDDSLAALVSGASTARSLFQRGDLRVDGDARVAHRLGAFNQLA
jgi:3-hydroxyacyl-CoA dehydrogenase/3a,7a,12a-trihydroxy-5b-cholest-24-enoyl-CoA hydratase